MSYTDQRVAELQTDKSQPVKRAVTRSVRNAQLSMFAASAAGFGAMIELMLSKL